MLGIGWGQEHAWHGLSKGSGTREKFSEEGGCLFPTFLLADWFNSEHTFP